MGFLMVIDSLYNIGFLQKYGTLFIAGVAIVGWFATDLRVVFVF